MVRQIEHRYVDLLQSDRLGLRLAFVVRQMSVVDVDRGFKVRQLTELLLPGQAFVFHLWFVDPPQQSGDLLAGSREHGCFEAQLSGYFPREQGQEPSIS